MTCPLSHIGLSGADLLALSRWAIQSLLKHKLMFSERKKDLKLYW